MVFSPKSQIHCHSSQELLELDGLQPLEELRRAAGASSAPNVFTAVRRAVRQQQLLASVAESVARKTLRTAEGSSCCCIWEHRDTWSLFDQ